MNRIDELVAEIEHIITIAANQSLHEDLLPGGVCEECPDDAHAALAELATIARNEDAAERLKDERDEARRIVNDTAWELEAERTKYDKLVEAARLVTTPREGVLSWDEKKVTITVAAYEAVVSAHALTALAADPIATTSHIRHIPATESPDDIEAAILAVECRREAEADERSGR